MSGRGNWNRAGRQAVQAPSMVEAVAVTTPLYHWRRHDESAYGLLGDHADTNICATACGRLVAYQEAVGDPGEASCPECERIHGLLELEADETPARDVLIAYAQKHNLWCKWSDSHGWVPCGGPDPEHGVTEDLNAAAIRIRMDRP